MTKHQYSHRSSLSHPTDSDDSFDVDLPESSSKAPAQPSGYKPAISLPKGMDLEESFAELMGSDTNRRKSTGIESADADELLGLTGETMLNNTVKQQPSPLPYKTQAMVGIRIIHIYVVMLLLRGILLWLS